MCHFVIVVCLSIGIPAKLPFLVMNKKTNGMIKYDESLTLSGEEDLQIRAVPEQQGV